MYDTMGFDGRYVYVVVGAAGAATGAAGSSFFTSGSIAGVAGIR